MAPRSPESIDQFLARLERAAAAGETQVRLGAPHHSHAVCREAEGWSLRRLESDRAAEQKYQQEHGHFMPEHREMLAVPGEVEISARPLGELLAAIEARWPLA